MNASKGYRSPAIQRLLMRPPKLAQRLAAPRSDGPSQPGVVGRLLKRLRKANIVRSPWRPISASLCQEIADCVRDDVDLLGRLLRRDLTHWLDEGVRAAGGKPAGARGGRTDPARGGTVVWIKDAGRS
jgi:hypothetical protein